MARTRGLAKVAPAGWMPALAATVASSGPAAPSRKRRWFPDSRIKLARARRFPDNGRSRSGRHGQRMPMTETKPQQDQDYDPEADPDTDPPVTGETVEADEDRDQAE